MGLSNILEISAPFLASLGGAGIVIIALSSWLGKVWASRLMESEKHENQKQLTLITEQLKKQNSLELEKIRFEMESLLKSRQIKFEYLHEKRADALIKLYALIESVKKRAQIAIALSERKLDGNWEHYSTSVSELYTYFNQNKLLFTSKLATTVDDLNWKITAPNRTKKYVIDYRNDELKEEGIIDMINDWKSTEKEIRKTMKEIEGEFRSILAVE